MSQVTILNSDPGTASWPITAKVTRLDANGSGFDLDFTKRDGAGSWSDYTPPGWGGPIEYTLWIVIKVNDRTTVDFEDENDTYRKRHFAMQGHDPGTVLTFRKVEYRQLKK